MFVDSHAHIDDPRFDEDRPAMLQRARDAGIHCILTIGNGKGPDDMGCGIPYAEEHDWIYSSVGVHPHDASKVQEQHYDVISQLAKHQKVVAIGEMGLDYYYDNSPRDVQCDVFGRQLEIAAELDKPIIVHTREADSDTETILKSFPHLRGVLHCFTSSRELAEFAVENGWMISFSGIVTFQTAQPLVEIARSIPSDRILIETDCPYLAPVPHRGKRNEPAFVADTARFLAQARGVDVAELARETTANFTRLFSIGEKS
jgi:TatD DNase family protein